MLSNWGQACTALPRSQRGAASRAYARAPWDPRCSPSVVVCEVGSCWCARVQRMGWEVGDFREEALVGGESQARFLSKAYPALRAVDAETRRYGN